MWQPGGGRERKMGNCNLGLWIKKIRVYLRELYGSAGVWSSKVLVSEEVLFYWSMIAFTDVISYNIAYQCAQNLAL